MGGCEDQCQGSRDSPGGPVGGEQSDRSDDGGPSRVDSGSGHQSRPRRGTTARGRSVGARSYSRGMEPEEAEEWIAGAVAALRPALLAG